MQKGVIRNINLRGSPNLGEVVFGGFFGYFGGIYKIG